jgi:tetratricopeptide (TPR) repeat protein
LLLLCGCAGSVERWIVATRVHQGDDALARGNVKDAELSYQLALRVDPKDERAQAGFVAASAYLAQEQYQKGQFDDALVTLREAGAFDPQSVRIQALRAAVDQAKLKREIVISNYPTYTIAGQQIQRGYEELDLSNKTILKSLKRFNYSYDTQDLTKAIKQSYDLQLDVAKNVNRLIAYRQLVESGVPSEPAAAGGSLLPLP